MSKKIFIFLSIAISLYLLDWLLNSDDENIIYVSDNDIDFLIATWNDQMQRPPSKEELKTIIENFIQNEVLYREALKLNLDRGDIIVKRRLVQKLGFLKQEEGVKIPNDNELKKYFDENKGEFRIPKRLSFNHVFFSKESRSLEEVKQYLVDKNSYLPEFSFIKDKLLDTYLLVKKDEVLKKYTEDLIKSYDVSLSKKYSFE